MSLRACIYKNCDSYNIHGASTPENVTLFQFPKDLERRQKWMELGQVPSSCPANALFMCSLHFEDKYLCVNNRRTILVGQAIPIPSTFVDDIEKDGHDHVDETEDGWIDAETGDHLFDKQSMSPVSETGEFQLESEISDEELSNANASEFYGQIPEDADSELDSPSNKYDDTETCDLPQNVSRRKANVDLKRKADSPTKKYVYKRSPAERPASRTVAASSTMNLCQSTETSGDDNKQCAEDADASDSDENAIDGSHVTTFIFKGEKYVQMPKYYYVREKKDLLIKIKKLETKIENIRKSVNTILNANDG